MPTSVKELERRGWAAGELDIVFFSGDAYVDHPSFGTAVLGRVLEAEGFRIAIVPQPNWQDDLRDFRKFGRPRLFFAVSAGVMDSMVNKYTANRRLRNEDAYTPDGRHDQRPEYPTIVYTQILKRLYPDVPVVIGGIEASLRRLTHYDYWQERLRPSILVDSGADYLIYGMGEQPIAEFAHRLKRGENVRTMPQIAYLDERNTFQIPSRKEELRKGDEAEDLKSFSSGEDGEKADILLASHEECLRDKRAHARNFRIVEEESNNLHAHRLLQCVGERTVVVNPPYPPMTTKQLDRVFDLPYTRLPHPRYKGKRIPAFEMIKFSVNIHRGCFGGCAFCTISAHQGKFIVSRSVESVVREVKVISQMPDFKGYISDLGGPSANMYRMGGKNKSLCARCRRPSCLHPAVCKNLDTSHKPLLALYHAVDALPEVKKSFIGSGIRYDLVLASEEKEEYARELITRHVSGRLKVAPEHTSPIVLDIMRKPSFSQFERFNRLFQRICRETGLNQQLIPYFISSHPGCTAEDMAELAAITRRLHFQLEQVQDFTPTPMTVSTTAWYTGLHPYTLKPLFSARTPQDKQDQRRFFFWYKPEERRAIITLLQRMGRADLIDKLFINSYKKKNS